MPLDGDKVIIIEDVITAGTAVRGTQPGLQSAAKVTVEDMFISVNRCEVGQTPGKTAITEVEEEFGIKVHALVTVEDIRDYLTQKGGYEELVGRMKEYMDQYCVL